MRLVLMTGSNLYSLFHANALAIHFGLKPYSLEFLHKFENFDTLIERIIPNERQSITVKKHYYEWHKAPKQKLSQLLKYLKQQTLRPCSCLDVGSGNNRCLSYLTRILNLSDPVGFEPNADSKYYIGTRTRLFDDLNKIPDDSFELVTMIHVLHHIDVSDHGNLLVAIRRKLKPSGLLYIFEDSWDDERNPKPHSLFDVAFKELSVQDKRVFLQMNEYWANEWFYQRCFDSSKASYYEINELTTLLQKLNYRIITTGCGGINFKRLHGVPSGWVIAKQTDRLCF